MDPDEIVAYATCDRDQPSVATRAKLESLDRAHDAVTRPGNRREQGSQPLRSSCSGRLLERSALLLRRDGMYPNYVMLPRRRLADIDDVIAVPVSAKQLGRGRCEARGSDRVPHPTLGRRQRCDVVEDEVAGFNFSRPGVAVTVDFDTPIRESLREQNAVPLDAAVEVEVGRDEGDAHRLRD